MAAGKLVYGGSFNPVHIGHVRLALEALDMMHEYADHLDFVPCARPPHKRNTPVLPLDLRASMIRESIKGIAGLDCSLIEAELPGMSYTVKTLTLLKDKNRGLKLYFLLGSGDFVLLPEWRDGLGLPRLCSLVVVPRGDYSVADFDRDVHGFWHDSAAVEPGPSSVCTGESGWRIRLDGGADAFFLPLPHLAVSSTRIRKMWLCRKNLTYLVPGPALAILNREAEAARACWQEKQCSM